MASTAAASGWLRGRVKAVPSGDCLVIMALTKADIPPEKTITLSSLIAPRLARRGGIDEPFAWDSREYLRKLCIGKEVTFRVDYTVPSIGREFGSVFLGDKNVALLVVSEGWAKVREQGQQKGEVSPFLAELQRLEEQAKQQGLGRWSKVPGASEKSIRNLPPSAIGDPSNLDAMGLLAANKGTPMQGIVEQVRDGSTIRVYLLPEFQFVQVFVAGIQAPSMGRRAVAETVVESEVTSEETNGEASAEPRAPLTSAQRLAASTASSTEVAPDPFGREAKHFTEIRVLNRDVRIVLEGVDKYSNLVGSVYYPDGDSAKDLALELVQNGLAKYLEWSANMMEEDAKRRLKNAELQAKKDRLRIWTNYVPPQTNSKAIHDQKFTGKVVEVVSGDCIIVADDAVPYGSPQAERRVNLSSIRCPKIGNPRRDEKPAPYAREAREFLRTRLIGRQVNVSMEYSRKVGLADGPVPAAGSADSRIMDFGSVFLVSPSKVEGDEASPSPTVGNQTPGVNVAELVIARGFGSVIRHRDFEERSNYYDALLAAESRAVAGRKGIHSAKDPPVLHITDLLTASAKKAKDFLPFLQRSRRLPAVVEYVLSGHRFKLLIPKETCSIAFSFSGVRCPGRDEPYSDEAIALMRRKILQRDVEIEVETVDRTGTFLGSLWESKTNVAVTLLEAGLAKLQTAFGADRMADAHLLAQAEQSAKQQRLKIWENYVEGQEVVNGSDVESSRQKEVLKVVVTEVLGGGKFYVQTVGDQKVAAIQQQFASLSLQEAPVVGAFNPKRGDIVLAQFSADNSWNRAMTMLKAPDHQVAGHQARDGCLGPLIDDSGRFYKPLQNGVRGCTEVAFYTSFSSNSRIPSHVRRFYPIFYGTQLLEASDGTGMHPHLVLQNLLSNSIKPSVMDVKIGSRTWSPQASENYVQKCLKKDRQTTSLALGFRISGLQAYVNEEMGFWKPEKKLIQGFTVDDVKLSLRKFVSSNPSSDKDPDCSFASIVYGGSDGILAQLLQLKQWFEDQTIFHFYACSILMKYEREAAEAGKADAEIKLVDFAHVEDGEGVIDHNFLGGLCSLIKLVSDILTNPDEHTIKDGLQESEKKQLYFENGSKE